MASPAAIFNIFQDATIVAITGQIPGTLCLEVDCDHLRDRLEGPGNRFFLNIADCARFAYKPSSKHAVVMTELAAIAARRLWIRDADQHEGLFVVHCSEHIANGDDGNLEVVADQIRITIDNGREISASELEEAAEEYWSGLRSQQNPI